jgi:DNA-binding NarL/FixJ family response regulator
VVRNGFRALLERNGFEVVAEADNGTDAVALAQTVSFNVALLDLSMPRMNGIDCARAILTTAPDAAIIMLTMHTDEQQLATALRFGIRGYVSKTQPIEELLQAIREVARGGTYLGPDLSRLLVSAYRSGMRPDKELLTRRERQVLQLVAEGHTTKQVATTLGLTTKTADSYRTQVMAKLDIHNTAGLVRYAIQRGLTPLALSAAILVGAA